MEGKKKRARVEGDKAGAQDASASQAPGVFFFSQIFFIILILIYMQIDCVHGSYCHSTQPP